jgi:uncharacterized protein (DUF433 family)
MPPHARLIERNEDIVRRYLLGESVAAIAATYDLVPQRVTQLTKAVRSLRPSTTPGAPVADGPVVVVTRAAATAARAARRKAERHADFMGKPRTQKAIRMYQQGITLEKIGLSFGLTRERIRQILKRAGINAKDGGQAKRIALGGDIRAARLAMMNAKSVAKYGMAYAEYKALPTKMKNIFRWQAATARCRGIEWKLKFGEWYAVWMSSGKWEQRGRQTGQYVMSRIRDDGPYELGNVHIQTCNENGSEATRKWIGKTKANPGVFCLYPGTTRPYFVKHRRKWIGRFATEAEAIAAKAEAQAADPTASTGKGRGWTFYRNRFVVQYRQKHIGGFKTQAEAEDAYRLAHLKHQGLYRPALDFRDRHV